LGFHHADQFGSGMSFDAATSGQYQQLFPSVEVNKAVFGLNLCLSAYSVYSSPMPWKRPHRRSFFCKIKLKQILLGSEEKRSASPRKIQPINVSHWKTARPFFFDPYHR